MLYLTYSIGNFFFLFIAGIIFLSRQFQPFSFTEKMLMISVAILPLGKLIFFPIEGFTGLRFQFIFVSGVSILWFFLYGIHKRVQVLFLSVIVAIASLFFLVDYSDLFFHAYIEKAGVDAGGITGTTESSLLRVASYFLLVLYASVMYSFLIRYESGILKLVARLYILGLTVACCIGGLIFYNVWKQNFSVEDLELITPGSPHFIDNFYRFNPGANVNEFSMLLAFGIYLLVFASFNRFYGLILLIFFLICEAAGLTRSSWLALLVGCFIASFFLRLNFLILMRAFLSASLTVMVLFVVYIVAPSLRDLFQTRFALDIGVSGLDRLEKFEYVLSGMGESTFRMLFGYGWGTNLYVHNVYLQLVSEAGVLGLSMLLISLAVFLSDIIKVDRGAKKFALIGIIIFIAVSAFMQHTLYHLQTWFMFAFIAAAANIQLRKSCSKENCLV